MVWEKWASSGKADLATRGSLLAHEATGTHSSTQKQSPTSRGGGVGGGGGGAVSATYLADDVHQARKKQGAEGDMGREFEEDFVDSLLKVEKWSTKSILVCQLFNWRA